MQFLLLSYPQIDPVLIEIMGFPVRWYSLSYILGILLAWGYVRQLNKHVQVLGKEQMDAIITWGLAGVMLGGRLGYVLFYKPMYFLDNPAEILMLWNGGMSFHGGMIGVAVAIYCFTRVHKLPFFAVMDYVAASAPIGLFLGRLANFINGELYGRVSDAEWAMVFPADPLQLPRHPSQLYEAALEGLVLFALIYLVIRICCYRVYPGMLSALFLVGYGAARIIAELYREPDAHLGFILEGMTMGQLLSVPMILLGLFVASRAWRKGKHA